MSAENVALAVFAALPVALAFAARAYLRRARRRATARGAAGPGRVALFGGNALVLLFLLSVALLAGECWLRFVYDGTDTFWLLRTSDRWFARHFVRNRDGFRDDRDYDLGPLPAGRRRVTLLGDSFTTGHGIADVNLRFAGILRARRPGWDVQVFAQNGADTAQEIDLLARRVPAYTKNRYRADLVVLIYGLNDICDIDPEIGTLGRELAEARDRGLLTRSSYVFDTLRFLWITATNDDVRAFFPRLAALYEDGPVWDAQQDRLRVLRAAVQARGGRLAAVTFPMLHELGEHYPLRAAHERLSAFWAAEGVPHLDLLPAFEGRDAGDLVVGAFDAHPNESAHAIAAGALLPFVDEVLAER